MNNWHPQSHYHPHRLGVDGIIFIEVCAFALIALAAMWLGYL